LTNQKFICQIQVFNKEIDEYYHGNIRNNGQMVDATLTQKQFLGASDLEHDLFDLSFFSDLRMILMLNRQRSPEIVFAQNRFLTLIL
jgi:hypothetical protein